VVSTPRVPARAVRELIRLGWDGLDGTGVLMAGGAR